MSTHMFMAIATETASVNGESTDNAYPNQIEITGWSWGASQTGTSSSGQGSSAGKVSVTDLTYTAAVDKSVPPLMAMCLAGTAVKTATLTICKATGSTPLAYLTIVMTAGLISNVTFTGTPGSEIQTVSVSLNFTQVQVTYTPQNADGTGAASLNMGWNIAKSCSL